MRLIQSDRLNRICWLDALKGILCLCIILSHSFPLKIYRLLFTPFFLTMFFFVSGFLFFDKDEFGLFLLKKWRHLIRPFLILGMMRVIIISRIEGGSLVQSTIKFLLQINCYGDEMWFLSCLFISSNMFYGILSLRKKVGDKYKDVFLLGSSFVITTLGLLDICVLKIKLIWEVEIACMMTFYMALGYFYKKHQNIAEKNIEKSVWILVLAVLYLFSVFTIPNDVDIHAERFQYPMLFFLTSLLAIFPIYK